MVRKLLLHKLSRRQPLDLCYWQTADQGQPFVWKSGWGRNRSGLFTQTENKIMSQIRSAYLKSCTLVKCQIKSGELSAKKRTPHVDWTQDFVCLKRRENNGRRRRKEENSEFAWRLGCCWVVWSLMPTISSVYRWIRAKAPHTHYCHERPELWEI